jgi:hypothetical protein
MPFLFLHVSRYWSNADQKCMPQFDANNAFSYAYLDDCIPFVTCIPTGPHTGIGNSVYATVSNLTSIPGGFWGAATSSSPSDQPNIRITDLKSDPPRQFGNSIDFGGFDPKASYLQVNPSVMPNNAFVGAGTASRPTNLVLELWDSATGQGFASSSDPNLSANWPPPSNCVLEVQPPIFTPVSCTATLVAETLAYGLPQPPVGGSVIYTLSSGTISPTNPPCDAIAPCSLAVTIPAGSGTYTLTATDAVAPPVGLSSQPSAFSNLWPWPASVPLSCSANIKFNFPTTGPAACAGGSFTLTVAVAGAGTVKGTGSSGAPIDCINTGTRAIESGTCSALYANGNAAGLTATPSSGWKFSGWGNCSIPNNGGIGTPPSCAMVVTGSLTVDATFVALGTPN